MNILLNLSDDDKLIVLYVCICATVVSLTLLICKICPLCPLHNHCPCAPQTADPESGYLSKPSVSIRSYYEPIGGGKGNPIIKPPNIDIDQFQYILTQDMPVKLNGDSSTASSQVTTPNPNRNGSQRNNASRRSQKRNSKDSTKFSFRGTENLSERSSVSEDMTSKCCIDFALQYDPSEQKLIIHVVGCRNLPSSLYGTASDCFVRVVLIKDFRKGWFTKKNNLSIQDLTKADCVYDTVQLVSETIRRNLNPTFNECHIVELTEKEKKMASLKFAVSQIDKFGRHLVIGSCMAHLDKDILNERITFTKPLKQYLPNLGEVCLTLNYLPTAERLCVTVERANALRLADSKSVGPPNPFVKVSLINRGKIYEKHKTTTIMGCSNPEFKQLMNFDLPPQELDKVTVIVSIQHQIGSPDSDGKLGVSSMESSGSGSSEDRDSGTGNHCRRKSITDVNSLQVQGSPKDIKTASKSTENLKMRPTVIGRLALGENVTGGGRSHWHNMVMYARQPTTATHKLIP